MNFSIPKSAVALVLLITAGKIYAAGFGDLIKNNLRSNGHLCLSKPKSQEKPIILTEIFPDVIYKTPGRDAGSAQLFQPVRSIAEPLAKLGLECSSLTVGGKVTLNDNAPSACDDFRQSVEKLVEADALRFDREKHKLSKVSFATGTLSGNFTIRPIALYISALRDAKLIRFDDDVAINNWLKLRVKEYEEIPSKLTPVAAQNHILHSILAKLTVGIAVGAEEPALQQAEDIYRLYMDTARSDGSFPRETNRGVSALKYQNMTITGLLVLAELAAYRGKDFYSYKSARGVDIHQAIKFFLRSYVDNSVIEEYSRENYAPTDRDDGTGQSKLFVRDHMGWIPIYLRKFRNTQSGMSLAVLAATPGVKTVGIYDENLGGISGCTW